mmetsp:Transcript_66301/g.188094  ORF Transcript_66301/g.188094 Transcript_66301/m.188094 type:complete len:94 (-) Transcript_66301:114-395(-)
MSRVMWFIVCLAAQQPALAQKSLNEHDICYRFCEDGSKEPVNRREDCVDGLTCRTTMPPGMMSFDNCNKPDTCQRSATAAPEQLVRELRMEAW